MYELNGYTYSLEEIQEAAARDGMSLQDFINKKGLKPTKDHQQKIDNKGEPNGFQKIINGIGDYFLGQDGDMATAWNNGKILREAYDGINEAFNIDTDDPNYSLTPQQAQAFYNSLKSRGNMEEVEAMNAWNKTFDETVEKDRKLVWAVAHSAAYRDRGVQWSKLARILRLNDPRIVKRRYQDALIKLYYKLEKK